MHAHGPPAARILLARHALAALAFSLSSARTVDFDWDLPRAGPYCLTAAENDVLRISWSEHHNLRELPDQRAHSACDFSAATSLAAAGPNAGVSLALLSAGTRYFACSKICSSHGHKLKVCVGSADCPGCTAGHTVMTAPVPVDCAGSWSSWGECSEPCGGGLHSRTYTVTTQASNGGTACPSPTIESQPCSTQGCPVDCAGSWSSWGNCSEPCGGGLHSRTHTVTTQASNGGTACPSPIESQQCSTQGCPVDCAGSWSSWGNCSEPCGEGLHSRTYTVTALMAHGGEACPIESETVELASCNERLCPVNCEGEWTAWGSCTSICGGGVRERMYNMTTRADNGGTNSTCAGADNEAQTQACNAQLCPLAIACVGVWSYWGACSCSCGGGNSSREYSAATFAAHGGDACDNIDGVTETRDCNSQDRWGSSQNKRHNASNGRRVDVVACRGATLSVVM